MNYIAPPEGTIAPLKITKSSLITKKMTILKDGSLQPADIPCFQIELQHLSSAYGTPSKPYEVTVPVHLTWVALKKPPTAGPGLPAYPNDQGARLLWAAGVVKAKDAPIPEDVQGAANALLGAHVMTFIQHSPDGTDYAHPWMYQIPKTDISLNMVDGTDAEAKITWETVHKLWLLDKIPAESIVDAVVKESGEKVAVNCMKGQWVELLVV